MFTRPTLYVLPLLLGFVASAFPPATYAAAARIVGPVDESDLIELTGNTHPLAIAKFDRGVVADSLPLEHMYVVLRRSPEQEQALEQLIQAQHDPQSASYHHWMTADELGRRFGPAQEDIDAVVGWLSSHGFEVNLVHKSGLTIDISGTAGAVRNAFHTEIHQYNVNGEEHIANSTDPQIPAALAPVVVGFASLNDFRPTAMVAKPRPNLTLKCTGCPDGFAGEVIYLETPPDFATIYNVAPLYQRSKAITGKGQTIVVLEESDILAADVATFRKAFGLSSFSGKFSQIHPGPGCADPGTNGFILEASVDAEWAGAVAPDATVELASCVDTATLPGILVAAVNLLDKATPPPIMSLSFGTCEAELGPGGNAFFNGLWQQADSEGVSVFVSAGDASAAGCDNFALIPNWAVAGIAASGYASTPHNVATGGTDFLATLLPNLSSYWSASNSPTGRSAQSYIPEMTWNDSCASSVVYTLSGFSSGAAFCNSNAGQDLLDIIGGSGAPSMIYSKPAWQQETIGVPSDGKRDLPDVSLFASDGFFNQAIVFCMSDASQGGSPCDYTNPVDAFNNSAGGTSFTAPQFASIQALINQKAGGRQGNPDPVFYALYKTEFGTASSRNGHLMTCNATAGNMIPPACIFHDVTLGNNDVPCFGPNNCFPQSATLFGVLSKSDAKLEVAYPAQTGWDFTSGLGSVNVTNLVTMWP